MNLMPVVDIRLILAGLPIATEMPSEVIEHLASIARLSCYPAGRVLFTEGEQHDQIHILQDGLVTLQMRVPGHGMRKILTVGRGDVVAWSSLLAEGFMTTSAIATEETHAIEFKSKELKALCDCNHELGYHVMHQVAIGLTRRLLATRLQLLDLFRE